VNCQGNDRQNIGCGLRLDFVILGRRMMQVIFRFAIAVIMSLSVAGCIESEKPLFDPSSATMPIQIGEYRRYSKKGGGIWKESKDEFTGKLVSPLSLRGRAYVFQNKTGEDVFLRFHHVRGGFFVLELKGITSKTFSYVLVKVSGIMGKRVELYETESNCQNMNEGLLAKFDMKFVTRDLFRGRFKFSIPLPFCVTTESTDLRGYFLETLKSESSAVAKYVLEE
jgi:hypothetical protein